MFEKWFRRVFLSVWIILDTENVTHQQRYHFGAEDDWYKTVQKIQVRTNTRTTPNVITNKDSSDAFGISFIYNDHNTVVVLRIRESTISVDIILKQLTIEMKTVIGFKFQVHVLVEVQFIPCVLTGSFSEMPSLSCPGCRRYRVLGWVLWGLSIPNKDTWLLPSCDARGLYLLQLEVVIAFNKLLTAYNIGLRANCVFVCVTIRDVGISKLKRICSTICTQQHFPCNIR